MADSHSVKKFVRNAALLTSFIFISNKYDNYIATRKKILKSTSDNFYEWNGIKVYWNKRGAGDPVLLIHAVHPASCAEEWSLLRDDLAKTNTVYEVDLPGCGRSDKEDDVYTNFYYVEFLRNFIEDMNIKGCAVIASNNSAAIALMADKYAPDLFSRIICINPVELTRQAKMPDAGSRLRKNIFYTPFIGELLYNTLSMRSQIDYLFSDEYFYNPFNDTEELVDTYYESAHLKDGRGRFLAGSMDGKFLNIDIRDAIFRCTKPLYLIFGSEIGMKDIIKKEWRDLNPQVKTYEVKHAKELPQLEEPENTLNIIQSACIKTI